MVKKTLLIMVRNNGLVKMRSADAKIRHGITLQWDMAGMML